MFGGTVDLQGLSGGVVGSSSDAANINIDNNVFRSGATLSVAGTMTNRTRFGNTFQGNPTPYIQDMPNYANDAAAAVGGVAVGGLYRNGSIIQVRVV